MTTATAGETAAPSPGNVVALRQPQAQALPAKIQYAHELANSGLLPAVYRRNPANVLWAIEFGAMLSLPPMAAITGVHVIEGKPTASAGLISALVRRAGHRLRVTGDDKGAVAEIVRCDDPEFTFRSEWTIERAEQAGLLAKKGGTWQKYPAAMLKARAITEVARDACEEALSGVHYTPEELGAEVDEDGQVVDAQVVQQAADDPWAVREAPEDVLTQVAEDAKTFSTDDAGRKLWEKTVQAVKDGTVTKARAWQVQELIKARWREIATAPADEPQPEPAQVDDGMRWLEDMADKRIPAAKDEADLSELEEEIALRLGDGRCPTEHGVQLRSLLADRRGELAEVPF